MVANIRKVFNLLLLAYQRCSKHQKSWRHNGAFHQGLFLKTIFSGPEQRVCVGEVGIFERAWTVVLEKKPWQAST
jgi:hypothetical protein